MSEETNLFPVVDIPDFTEQEEEYDREYRPSPAWDLAAGDFIRDATGKVMMNDGLEAYRIWCVKAVQTARYGCRAYNEDIGSEMDNAMKEADENAVELAIERTVKETLLANPRTETVEDFSFSWDGDSVKVTFWVHGVEWEAFPLAIIVKADSA